MTNPRRVSAMQVAIVLALLAVTAGSMLVTGFPFNSGPTPERIRYDGRDDDRGTKIELPPDAVRQDATDGGGVIYLDNGSAGTPTGLYVVDGGVAWGYGPVGGP